jgi:hypothetical protein
LGNLVIGLAAPSGILDAASERVAFGGKESSLIWYGNGGMIGVVEEIATGGPGLDGETLSYLTHCC